MTRFPVLFDFLGPDLLEVAAAMADGSYWDEGRPWEGETPYGSSSEPSLGSWED